MKPDLLMMGPLHAPTQARLEALYTTHRYDLAADKPAFLAQAAAAGHTAMATRGDYRITDELLAQLPALRLIASFGVGHDGIDTPAASRRGIVVTNTPDVLSECVADATWALILSTVRRTVWQDRFVREGRWPQGPAPLTGKVWGERLGIVGLGRIGKAIARRAEGFGMSVAYSGRRRQADVAFDYVPDVTELAHASTVLVVATPGGPETRGLIGAGVIQALGPEGYLINISRGSTVDEAGLLAALGSGQLAGAGLDVFQGEPHVNPAFFELPNVVLQPHAASATHHTRQAMGQLLLDNLAAYAEGRPVLTPVGADRPA
ncbi:lactate dehydrogenase-like 2-hydroxyacid dehydrogenase [Comamonas sp. BIGb0124]|uniref:2-hydroxyacid dehydrogenase n=1 Tax=Comamonas sp. BIGb0124 TaxID=2485130 RepID=UPI000F48B96E|nr:2-hydroxyacid dehydrogenase [Comamonas sp. BIGb0124]ROR22510.1 lactate dehydrogenase-like 2-hydroxyacid dehydrogenase [Comamonas sp. BIGb0124]